MATYLVHLRLMGKPIVDFLFVTTGLFSLGVMAEALTSEYRSEMAAFEGGGSLWSKISGSRGRPPPTILPIGKLCMDLACGI